MEWWVARAGRKPIGPVSTELMLEGIAAGKVPSDAFVCEVRKTTWTPISETRPFGTALIARGAAKRIHESDVTDFEQQPFPESTFPPPPAPVPVRAPTRPRALTRADDTEERTTIDTRPRTKPR
jgi:hypothetical protein